MKTRSQLLLMVIVGMLTACGVTPAEPTATPTPTPEPTGTPTQPVTVTPTMMPSQTLISLEDITAQQVQMFLSSTWVYSDASVSNLEIIHGVNGLGVMLSQGPVNIFQGLLLGGVETPDSFILVLGEQGLGGNRFATAVRILKSLVLDGGGIPVVEMRSRGFSMEDKKNVETRLSGYDAFMDFLVKHGSYGMGFTVFGEPQPWMFGSMSETVRAGLEGSHLNVVGMELSMDLYKTSTPQTANLILSLLQPPSPSGPDFIGLRSMSKTDEAIMIITREDILNLPNILDKLPLVVTLWVYPIE